jgi:hypothetical protein
MIAAAPSATSRRPPVSFWNILNMNVGFFGLQYSFGLQQTNMSPIYSYLGADPEKLPFLWLAGPLTGLLVQPIVGAMSDRTTSRWGRRTPYFLVGALVCSVCLLAMPFSSAVWMAASLLWILDAANNVTQEPYRAFVSDQLPAEQVPTGFLTQSFFTGLGITLANFTPSVLVYLGLLSATARSSNNIPHTTYVAFFIGAAVSIGAILYSVLRVREKPLAAAAVAAIRAEPGGVGATLREIGLGLAPNAPCHAPNEFDDAIQLVRHLLLLAVHHAVFGAHYFPHHRPALAGLRASPAAHGRGKRHLQRGHVCERFWVGGAGTALGSPGRAPGQPEPGWPGLAGPAQHPRPHLAAGPYAGPGHWLGQHDGHHLRDAGQ